MLKTKDDEKGTNLTLIPSHTEPCLEIVGDWGEAGTKRGAPPTQQRMDSCPPTKRYFLKLPTTE